MDKPQYGILEVLVADSKHSNLVEKDLLDFGNSEYSPDKESIKSAEKYLNIKFPPSYKWFLERYGEGEILDNFLFIVVENEPNEELLNDIVHRTFLERSDNLITDKEILLFSTNFSDFIWRTDEVDEDGEFPVYLQLGEHREYYAPNYVAFLIKYIKSCLEEN